MNYIIELMKSLIKIILVIVALIMLIPIIMEFAEQYVASQIGNLSLVNLTDYLFNLAKLNVTETSISEDLLSTQLGSLYYFFVNHLIVILLAAFFLIVAQIISNIL